jgi:hypothetical protein
MGRRLSGASAIVAMLLLAGPSAATVRNVSIAVTESISPSTAPPGGSVTVSFSATNNGTDVQAPFSLVFFLGPGDWSVGGANDGCARPNQYDIDCERGSLSPGETFSSSVTVTLGADAPPGAIYNSRAIAFPGGTSGGGLGSDARSIQIAQPPAPPPPPPPSPRNTATLSVTVTGAGSGTVSSTPDGIACGAVCSSDWLLGTSVALTATPASGSSFAGWSGACSTAGTAATCVVVLGENATATASFGTAPTTTTDGPPPITTVPTPDVVTVPQLVGLRLTTAITRLAHARCRLGTVTKRHARAALVGRVVAQQPEAGQYVDPGQKIRLVVGKR